MDILCPALLHSLYEITLRDFTTLLPSHAFFKENTTLLLLRATLTIKEPPRFSPICDQMSQARDVI